MTYSALRGMTPRWLRAQVLHFEVRIEEELALFARATADGARVLDAGAGEGRYRDHFPRHRYTGIDLAVGDKQWDYSCLDCLGDLLRLPFRDGVFDGFLSIVTLEHVTRPWTALEEMARVAKPGARLFLVLPLEWEVHQHPHDYWRFTRFTIRMLLADSGWEIERLEAVGGFFRLLSRRIMNALQFFPGWLAPIAALALVPLGLVTAMLDPLDPRRDFTLGYICWAKRKIEI